MKCVSFILFLLVFQVSFCQIDEINVIYEKFESIFQHNNDQEKLEANTDFKNLFVSYLNDHPGAALENPFEPLQMFKELAPNGKFRVFNWNIPLSHKNQYECIFALIDNDQLKVIECTSHSMDISSLSNKTLDHNHWPAALYYDIIPVSKRKKNQFVLLGWDGNDLLTNRKIIEVITVNSKTIKFGAPIFKDYPAKVKRVVFEYSEDAVMSLSHDKKSKRLVFDHLAPSQQNLKGQYQFYGPDMTFDSFVFNKGVLLYQKDITFERSKNSKDQQFRNPKG